MPYGSFQAISSSWMLDSTWPGCLASATRRRNSSGVNWSDSPPATTDRAARSIWTPPAVSVVSSDAGPPERRRSALTRATSSGFENGLVT